MKKKPEKPLRTITQDEFHQEMKEQGQADRKDIAFICPMCGTIQSMNSLIDAGCSPEKVENYIGFSCEGRFRGALSEFGKNKDSKRGCDWTLGGLFRLHKLEVIQADGTKAMAFELASKDEAEALAKKFSKEAVAN